MESDSAAKAVNAHGLLGLRRDLEAFEHVAETLAETVFFGSLGSEDERDENRNVLKASLGSLRVLLRLCAAPADDETVPKDGKCGKDGDARFGSLEAFVADAFADAAIGAVGDDPSRLSGNASATGAEPLTRARAARILEKYRDVPSNKGAGLDVNGRSGSFASKKRIDAVVKALKAR